MLVNVATRLLVSKYKRPRRKREGKEQNIRSLPRVVDPNISNCPSSTIPALENLLRQLTLLRLILVVQDED
jgi:hypothetical protein